MRRLLNELDEAIPSDAIDDPGSHFPSISTIRSLPYLSACINEAMRLYPVVAVGSKRTTLSDIEYEGIVIPSGSLCTLAYYSMFRQPWIENPDQFLPERWISSNQTDELREMLMPFALGSRNCIGQNLAKVELSLISSYLLRIFSFELVSEPHYEIFLTMKAKNARFKVSRRT